MNRSWGADPPAGPRAGHAFWCQTQTTRPSGEMSGHPEPREEPGKLRLADELAPMVAVWTRLLTLHLPDADGRCRTCTQGGTGLPGNPWPCTLHGLATLAARRHGSMQG